MSLLKNRIAGVNHATPPARQWANTLERFGLRAQLFHAVLTIALLFMVALGFLLDPLKDVLPPTWARMPIIVHKGLGLWVLCGGVAWFFHWLFQPTPHRLPTQPRPEYRLAKLVHRLLLILCVAMPLSGWIMVSAWGRPSTAMAPFLHMPAITTPDADLGKAMLGVHIVLVWVILALVAVHVAGALYHHFMRRDPIVTRMIPRFKPLRGYYRFNFDTAKRDADKLK